MGTMVTKLLGGMVEPEKYKHEPVKISPKDCAKHMVGKKKIAILTGAGISAASGIPTFRGQDGFWKKRTNYAGEEDPEEILTNRFFGLHPEGVWQWHYDFFKILKGCKTNLGHKAIREFQEYTALSQAKEEEVDSMLITQNIDDLHNQEIRASTILQKTTDKYYVKSENTDVAFTPHVYEIHGSVLFMHCEAEE